MTSRWEMSIINQNPIVSMIPDKKKTNPHLFEERTKINKPHSLFRILTDKSPAFRFTVSIPFIDQTGNSLKVPQNAFL